MKFKPSFIAILATAALPLFAQGQSTVSETKSKLDKWVETQQLISEEKNEWRVEQVILADTQKLLQDELEVLNERINEMESESTEADAERDALLMQRIEYKRAQASMEASIAALEEKLLSQIPRFPKPLQKSLDTFIVRIPEDPTNTKVSLSDRTLNLVGILSQTERFNKNVHLFGETEKLSGDEAIQVWRIYWGLGSAYYVDEQGTRAGVGTYSAEGWSFEENNDLAKDLATLRNIKEGTEDEVVFIPLPTAIR